MGNSLAGKGRGERTFRGSHQMNRLPMSELHLKKSRSDLQVQY